MVSDVLAAIDIGTTWIKCQAVIGGRTTTIYRARRTPIQTPEELTARRQEDSLENLIDRPLQLLGRLLDDYAVDRSECRLHLIESGYWPGTIVHRSGSSPLALMMHDLRAVGDGDVTDWSYRLDQLLPWVSREFRGAQVHLQAANSALVDHLTGANVVDSLTASGWDPDFPPASTDSVVLPMPLAPGTLINESRRTDALLGFDRVSVYVGLPDTAATIVEAGAAAGVGDYVLYLGSFAMLFRLTVPPTPAGIMSAQSTAELYEFVSGRPQEGQWAETLGLTRPEDAVPLPVDAVESHGIEVIAPYGEFAMQRRFVASGADWRDFARSRLSCLRQLPTGSTVFILGGGADAYEAVQSDYAGRSVRFVAPSELGALTFLRWASQV